MTPKTQYPKELIIDSAFEIAKTEGIDHITMRKVAEKIGGSVAPIYVNFKDIHELKEAVIQKIYALSRDFYTSFQTGNPFLDVGVASIRFAKEYSVIFRDLVMKENNSMKNYDEEMGFLIEEMKKDADLEGLTEEQLKTILLKMRVFQLGLSIMAANGHFPSTFTEEDIIQLLQSTAYDVVFSTRHNQSK